MSSIQCPTCIGSGKTTMHIHYADRPHEWKEVDCRTCSGTGNITSDQESNMLRGDQIAKARRICQLSQREFSVLSKVDYVKQSQIEDDISRGTQQELELIINALREAGKKRIAELEFQIKEIRELTQ